jgi:hypothetical protein
MMCSERNKAILKVIISIRNRMALMSQKTQEEIANTIKEHNITAQEIIDMCVEMNFSV